MWNKNRFKHFFCCVHSPPSLVDLFGHWWFSQEFSFSIFAQTKFLDVIFRAENKTENIICAHKYRFWRGFMMKFHFKWIQNHLIYIIGVTCAKHLYLLVYKSRLACKWPKTNGIERTQISVVCSIFLLHSGFVRIYQLSAHKNHFCFYIQRESTLNHLQILFTNVYMICR